MRRFAGPPGSGSGVERGPCGRLARRWPMACLALILAGVIDTLVPELWLKARA